jgi:hypothetical protein
MTERYKDLGTTDPAQLARASELAKTRKALSSD